MLLHERSCSSSCKNTWYTTICVSQMCPYALAEAEKPLSPSTSKVYIHCHCHSATYAGHFLPTQHTYSNQTTKLVLAAPYMRTHNEQHAKSRRYCICVRESANNMEWAAEHRQCCTPMEPHFYLQRAHIEPPNAFLHLCFSLAFPCHKL